MPTSAEQVANYIRDHAIFSPYVPRGGYPQGIWYPQCHSRPSAEELAEQMVEDLGFQALKLGGFLETPNGELIVEGVELALPNADRDLIELAVDALTLAAERQSKLTPLQVGGAILVGVLLLWLLGS